MDTAGQRPAQHIIEMVDHALADRIRLADSLPSGCDAAIHLLDSPIYAGSAVIIDHGMALYRAARKTITEDPNDSNGIARCAFHAAAQQLPPDTLAEIESTRRFKDLTRKARSDEPAIALVEALNDLVETTRGSSLLLEAVKENFKDCFRHALKVDSKLAFDSTISQINLALSRGTCPPLIVTVVGETAKTLPQLFSTTPDAAIRAATKLVCFQKPVIAACRSDPDARQQLRAIFYNLKQRGVQWRQADTRKPVRAMTVLLPLPATTGNVISLRPQGAS